MNDNQLKDFIICIHNTKGRLRFRLTAQGINVLKHIKTAKRDAVLKEIEDINGITKVKLNPIVASITLLYDHQLTNETTVISSLTSIINRSFFNKSANEISCKETKNDLP